MSIRLHTIPNRNAKPSFLLRHTWREGHRIRRRTLANLTKAPDDVVAAVDAVTRGGVVYEAIDKTFSIKRSLPHGHVACLYGMAQK